MTVPGGFRTSRPPTNIIREEMIIQATHKICAVGSGRREKSINFLKRPHFCASKGAEISFFPEEREGTEKNRPSVLISKSPPEATNDDDLLPRKSRVLLRQFFHHDIIFPEARSAGAREGNGRKKRAFPPSSSSSSWSPHHDQVRPRRLRRGDFLGLFFLRAAQPSFLLFLPPIR